MDQPSRPSITRRSIANIDCLVAEPAGTAAQTIICLPGIGGDHASFLPQTEGLAEQFRIVVWNMPGYGKSEPLGSVTFATMAASLKALIDQLGCAPVHIMGQSIGGMIAQELFHRYPQCVESLILVATTAAFGGKDDTFKNAFLAARLKPLDDGHTMQAIAAQAMPAIVGKNTDASIVQAAVGSMASINSDAYRQVLACLVTFDRRLEWPGITCPLLLIAGDEDTNAPALTMKKMAGKIPHAEYHEVTGAGHLVNLEMGKQVNNITECFIKRIADING